MVGEMVTWQRDRYLDPGVWGHIQKKLDPSILPAGTSAPVELPSVSQMPLQYHSGLLLGYPQLEYTKRHVIEETLTLPSHAPPCLPKFSTQLQIEATPAPPGATTKPSCLAGSSCHVDPVSVTPGDERSAVIGGVAHTTMSSTAPLHPNIHSDTNHQQFLPIVSNIATRQGCIPNVTGNLM